MTKLSQMPVPREILRDRRVQAFRSHAAAAAFEELDRRGPSCEAAVSVAQAGEITPRPYPKVPIRGAFRIESG